MPRYIRVSDSLQCRFLEGAWHLVTVEPLPTPYWDRERCMVRDILLGKPVQEISEADARRHYGAAVYAVAKRRLGRRELKQYPIPAKFWF